MMKVKSEYDTIQVTNKKINENIKVYFTKFLQQFQDENGMKKYIKKLEDILLIQKYSLLIKRQDIESYNKELAEAIFSQFSRYQRTINDALTELAQQMEGNLFIDYSKEQKISKQSLQEYQERYEVAFDMGLMENSLDQSIRNLKCEMLGKLMSIVVTVTRVSQIKPELVIGVFKCNFCGRMSERIPQQYKYTMPKKCLAGGCNNNISWELIDKYSVFSDFQKLRVQQDASKIPPGSMPRSIDVILRNDLIEKGKPGDQVHIVGYLAVIPDVQSLLKPGERTAVTTRNPNVRNEMHQEGVTGIKGIKELNYKLCFIANNIFVMNNQFNEEILTQEEQDQAELNGQYEYDEETMTTKIFSKLNQFEILQIKKIKEHPRKFQLLAESLFNQIFGHIEIKKALLLQLLGGVHKKTDTKISLRGDINILIVGDPSTAKSQFLKCVNKFVPRSVYTNGKTTTAAGLTASVVRDQDNGNVSIEAGALLLADNGICCIDEFDKMDIKDQVAIHEAMEQQTISIAKAGIQATLHARTSILAAANPLFGRYDKSQSLRKNINISPPIMSRFDLYFIICDEINDESDKNLSNFIVSMHKQKKVIRKQTPYTAKQVKNYISIAKRFKPRLTKQASKQLRRYYIQLRQNDKQKQNSQYQVTVRQLESMIRLSEALAKLHLDLQIKPEYVRDAFRLLSCAIVKLDKSAFQLADDTGISNFEKESLGLRSLISSNQQRQTKKTKIVVSQQAFEGIKRSIFQLFDQKQSRHRKDKIEDVDLYLTEEDIIVFLNATSMENCQITSQFNIEKSNKFYHAIISKLITDKYLIALEESQNISKRKLCIHPNAVKLQEINKYEVVNIEEHLEMNERKDKNL